MALEPLALDDDFADEEDFVLEEDFFVEELDFALLLLDFELSFLLLLDFAELPLLLLEFLTELLDTGSSESALLPLSPPHDARATAIARIIMDPRIREDDVREPSTSPFSRE
jgi:hypothetical protein